MGDLSTTKSALFQTQKCTPSDLLMAMKFSNLCSLEKLLSNGAPVNTRVRGSTLLSLAIYNGQEEIVELLIKAGADVNKFSQDHLGRIETPLCSACRLGNYNIVQRLLHCPNIDINKRDFFNKSALWIATNAKNVKIVELLLNSGADVSVADTWAECPLYLSMRYHKGRENISGLLIHKGCPVNIIDGEGRTPIYWAIKHADAKIFSLLLQAGAKVPDNVRCNIGSKLPKLWSENPDLMSWIMEVTCSPCPLSWQARVIIRECLINRWKQIQEDKVGLLPIPESTKKFIKLSHLT